MRVNKSEYNVYFDVDNTLVIPTNDLDNPAYSYVDINDTITGGVFKYRIHEPMVRLLIEEYSRGSNVIVWSRGGYQWAYDVVVALQINRYVHEVMTKPIVYYDDLPIESWLKYRVYLGPDEVYKRPYK